jgi:hypothetical protein
MARQFATQLAENAVPIPARISPTIGADVLPGRIGTSGRVSMDAGVVGRSADFPLAGHTVIDDESDIQVS